MTIGRLAAAARVGVETIRYYQRRQLLPVPAAAGVRRYSSGVLHRVQFIKHAQALGFALVEIRELLRLEDGGTRAEVRQIAGARLKNVRDKLAALQRMERVLGHLLADCEASGPQAPCPIIGALASGAGALGAP
ncbi:MAG: MerR family DNA-binding protein [Gammaproteobacteria bacterium]|nr:MerR family DNA-binding protein [Gammaproteobacteria bacterium]